MEGSTNAENQATDRAAPERHSPALPSGRDTHHTTKPNNQRYIAPNAAGNLQPGTRYRRPCEVGGPAGLRPANWPAP